MDKQSKKYARGDAVEFQAEVGGAWLSGTYVSRSDVGRSYHTITGPEHPVMSDGRFVGSTTKYFIPAVRLRKRKVVSGAIASDTARRFVEAARRLREVVIEARELCPTAELYLAGNTLHLLDGPSHDDTDELGALMRIKQRARQDRSVASFTIPELSGGDW